MTEGRQNQTWFRYWIFLFYLIFFASIIFSLRAITSISIAVILLSGLIANKMETGTLINKKLFSFFSVCCFLFYAFQFAGFLFTHNTTEQWRAIRMQSALLFVPLAINSYQFSDQKKFRQILISYCIILLTASLYCLVMALVDYSMHNNSDVFFYHDLVKPISQHAVQFSILVFIALVFLFESFAKDRMLINKYIHTVLIVFLSVFIVLLSSKLVIAFYLLYIIFFLFAYLKTRRQNRAFVSAFIILFMVMAGVVLVTRNPVSRRFSDIMKENIEFITQMKFTPADYFNGVQFRLLQWRFVSNILTENNAWAVGVSAGDAQAKLDEKYISENMYVGEAYRHDRGFLGYNTHNQFLESLLQNGIIGAMLFVLVWISMIKMAWEKKDRLLSFVTILLLLYSLSESVFESQYSLLIFIFFPLFFYITKTNGE